MRIKIFLFFFLIYTGFIFGQKKVIAFFKDSTDNSALPGVIVRSLSTGAIVQSNAMGIAELSSSEETAKFSATFTGYKELLFVIRPALKDTLVLMMATENELEEVTVSSTRTNSRVDDLTLKVEVLGQEEMNEEATMVPSGIGSILGDLSVITIQKTNPVNGNDAVRMQGLDYKYTQLLRDGLPLYEGFSGSLGVLAMPPLDLKQVEIIKGSASTLYGGGAIGGLINFISRTPTDSPAVTLTLNQTTLLESNVNTFLSKKNGKTGVTLFAGANLKQAVDVNKDGYSEVPEQNNFIFHPRLFFYPSSKTKADIGITLTSDNRRGGDMVAVKYKDDSLHSFLFSEKILRSTADAHLTHQLNENNSLTVKSTFSQFNRSLYYSGFNFTAKQISSYSEINHLYKNEKHNLVSGVNFVTEQLQKQSGDSVYFTDYTYTTLGLFAQENWQLFKKLSLEAGIRGDYHNRYHWFILPRLGIFWKASDKFSLRLHYGSGYKTPNLFTASQPTDYARLFAISNTVKPESSNGVNMDINYKTLIAGKLILQLNQAFYYTGISNPVAMQTDSIGNRRVANADYSVTSIGTDSYVRLQYDELELYLGYNHTEAKQKATNADFNMPFNPKDKFAVTLAYEIEKKWRMGVEAAYNANQYIYNNVRVPNFWFFAAMVERKFKFGSLVLNCENLGDYRQSRYEALVTGSTAAPVFKNIWGPLEGRVINLSLKVVL